MTIASNIEQRADRAKKLGWLVALIILLIIVADQWLKIWVKTHFYLGEDMEILPWFHLKFIENNGFAFGIEWLNKFVLTFGRIAAVIFFIWAIRKLICYKISSDTSKAQGKEIRCGFFIAFALIIAGAAGNIFDCVFYGEIFNNPPPPEVAVIFPQEGYAGWFEGRVVDMLYFPMFTFKIAGREFLFFEYIFNIADSAITIGVFLLILFYSKDTSYALSYLFENKKEEKKLQK